MSTSRACFSAHSGCGKRRGRSGDRHGFGGRRTHHRLGTGSPQWSPLKQSLRIANRPSSQSIIQWTGLVDRLFIGFIHDAGFRQAVRLGWKTAAAQSHIRESLQDYCVLCGQWVVMRSPGISTRSMRKAHQRVAAIWAFVSRPLASTASSPSRCQGHIWHIVRLSSRRLWRDLSLIRMATEDDRASAAQAELNAVLGGRQEGQRSGDSRRRRRTTRRRRWLLDKQSQAVMQLLVQLTLRHEAELGRVCSESAFIFFLDTPAANPELEQPGETIAVSVCDGPEGMSVRHEAFQVAFQVFDLGTRPTCHHRALSVCYQCAEYCNSSHCLANSSLR